MTRPVQLSLLDALTLAVVAELEEEDRAAPFPFDASGPECAPRSLDVVPAILRLPGEDGYVELDRNWKVVTKQGSAGDAG